MKKEGYDMDNSITPSLLEKAKAASKGTAYTAASSPRGTTGNTQKKKGVMT